MKVSGTGAAVGALVGCVARGAVTYLNVAGGSSEAPVAVVALPSAIIGALVGAMAGGVGRPLPAAAVGAVLSGVVFEAFMCSCASLIGRFSEKAGADFFSQTLIYGLEMAVAGAVAGAAGGWVAVRADRAPSAGNKKKEEGVARPSDKQGPPQERVE